MKTYELTYIISSHIKLEDADFLVKEVESLIQKKEGVILKSEKVMAKTLSYPIKKQSSGYFGTLEFKIETDKIKEVNEFLTKNNKFLRSFILIKNPVKVMKEKRFKKTMPSFTKNQPSDVSPYKKSKEEQKSQIEEIDKKLEEILSE